MRRAAGGLTALLLVALAPAALPAEGPPKRTPREALQPFNVLIGSWQAMGIPEGTLEQKRKGTWQETFGWEWQFKGDDAWLKVTFDKGKYFTEGTLRSLPDGGHYQLTLTTVDKQTHTFTGPLKDHRLVAERRDAVTKEVQRLTLSLVQDNRVLYGSEVQPEGRPFARKVYQVGATKVGQPLVAASGEIGPLCVVSYGPPLMEVAHKGKTYYVCCASCRQEFRADPEKYIKEYEDVLATMAKEKAAKSAKP